MYIATNETQIGACEVMNVLPKSIRRYMCNVNLDEAVEIHLVIGRPFSIRYPDGEYYLTVKSVLSKIPLNTVNITKSHMEEVIERITKSSLYSVKEEIRNGFITIEGGHRAGIAGRAVTENGSVEFIKNISAMNIRIANEVIGSADGVINDIVSDGMVKNTLIISSPGAGKTTMLRDVTRQLSYMGYYVSVADERCEIAAMSSGRTAFDLGDLTSVMDNCPKAQAMLMLLRSMSPDVIITDEIGTDEDREAVLRIINSGVSVIASIHGRDAEQVMRRKDMAQLVDMFDVLIVLSKRNGVGTIEEIRKNE